MSNDLTRRSFVKWGTAAAGAATLAGFTGCANSSASSETALGDTSIEAYPGEKGDGQWLTGACMNNCSCEHSRCLLRVYVEDGVPLRIRTDEEEDSIEIPQRRACPRGRAPDQQHDLSGAHQVPHEAQGLEPRRPQWRDARS